MTVYHGSLVEVPVPELRESENVGDFGCGFYVTRSHEQATRFVRTKAKRESLTRGFVSVYKLDEDVLRANFKGLVFDGPTREWARFVSDNRKRPSFSHGYDFVKGPVANDQVYATFSFYESGMISFEMLLDQLRVRKLFDQILLHTRESIGLLRFVRSEEISWQK